MEKAKQYILLGIMGLMIIGVMITKIVTMDRLEKLPDGEYHFGSSFCEDETPIRITTIDSQTAIKDAANLLMLKRIEKSLTIKQDKAVLLVKDEDCKVTVFMTIESNQNGNLRFSPVQDAVWEPSNCSFVGEVQDKEFEWTQKSLGIDDTLSSRGENYLTYKKEQTIYHTLNFLPSDITIKMKYAGDSKIHFVYRYKELIEEANKTEAENQTKPDSEDEELYSFGCPLTEPGYTLTVIPKHASNQ